MAYSMDLRIKVLEACDAGKGTQQVAEAFGVAASWVRRLKQRRREDGTLAPRPCGGSEPSLGPEQHARIHAHFQAHPDTTVAALREALGLEVSEVTVWRAARRLGYRFKKSRSTPANANAPTSSRPARPGPKASRRSTPVG